MFTLLLQSQSPHIQPYDLIFAILDELSTRDIMRFRRISRATCHVIDAYISVRLDMDRALTVYFGSSHQSQMFRHKQQRTGAVISGIFAFLFLHRKQDWLHCLIPLDVYLKHVHIATMGEFLFTIGFLYVDSKTLGSVHPRTAFLRDYERHQSHVQRTSWTTFEYNFTNGAAVVRLFGATRSVMDAIFYQAGSL